MLVYCVVIGDMLVGKEGYAGLLCSWLGGPFCGRPLVVGLVALFVLLPAVSFRSTPPPSPPLLLFSTPMVVLPVPPPHNYPIFQEPPPPPRSLPSTPLLSGEQESLVRSNGQQ